MVPLDREDAAQAEEALNSLIEPDPATGRRPTRTAEEWRRLTDHAARLRAAWERADRDGFTFHLTRIEMLSVRVAEIPGPAELPAPPELVEERNALVDGLDLVLEPGRGVGTGDASDTDDQ